MGQSPGETKRGLVAILSQGGMSQHQLLPVMTVTTRPSVTSQELPEPGCPVFGGAPSGGHSRPPAWLVLVSRPFRGRADIL